MESASYQHAQDEAALAVGQMQAATSNHAKAVMAGPEGFSVADTCDPRLPSPMDLPPVPDAASKHLGGDDSGYPA